MQAVKMMIPSMPVVHLDHEGDRIRRLGIDTGSEQVVFLREDSPVGRSEGFRSHSRLDLRIGTRSVLATLNIVSEAMLRANEVGLCESAWQALQPRDQDRAILTHPASVDSLASVRAKIFGRTLSATELHDIVADIVAIRYSSPASIRAKPFPRKSLASC